MNSTQPGSGSALATAAYQQLLDLLGSKAGAQMQKHRSDPQTLRKHGTSFMRLRVLPKPRLPSGFWSSDWCFYEIVVGPHPMDGIACSGRVQFVMYPDNAQCGSGRHTSDVRNVLHALRPGESDRFFLDLNAGPEGKAILCGFLFPRASFPEFPRDTAAANLAWLIQNTLPRFQSLT